MVRLREKYGLKEHQVCTNFNSCMVRLRAVATKAMTAANAFQFLYGAIKGVVLRAYYRLFNQFQFLYGAIKGKS